MNAMNHMAQSESKENAIANHKKETHVRKKSRVQKNALYLTKKKSFRKKKKQENHPFGS